LKGALKTLRNKPEQVKAGTLIEVDFVKILEV
jgi:hypothetical protein